MPIDKKIKRCRRKKHGCQSHRAWVMAFSNRLPLWWYPYPKNKVKRLIQQLRETENTTTINTQHPLDQWAKLSGTIYALPFLIHWFGNQRGCAREKNTNTHKHAQKISQSTNTCDQHRVKENPMAEGTRAQPFETKKITKAQGMSKERGKTVPRRKLNPRLMQTNCASGDIAINVLNTQLMPTQGDYVYLNTTAAKAYTIDLSNIERSEKSEYDLEAFTPKNTLSANTEKSTSGHQFQTKSIKLYPMKVLDEKQIFKSDTLSKKAKNQPPACAQLTDSYTLIREATAMIAGLTALVTPYDDRLDYLTAYQFNCMLMPIHDKLAHALELIESDTEKDTDVASYSMH